MKKIIDLHNKLTAEITQDFSTKYPQILLEPVTLEPKPSKFKPEPGVELPQEEPEVIDWPAHDGKIHVTFVAPYYNATGLYRSILPMLHLNQTETHSAIITNINKFELMNQNKEQPIELFDQIIAWSHYMVFPRIYSPEMVQIIKDIRQVNPNVFLLADIDDNNFTLPVNHHLRYVLTNEMKKLELDTLSHYDGIIGTNEKLLELYYNKMQEHSPDNKLQYAVLPNLMSKLTVEDLPKRTTELKTDVTRILLTLNPSQFHDINPFRKVLKAVKDKYKNKVEIIVFGWDGKVFGPTGKVDMNKNALKGVEHTYIPPVPLDDYFKTLHTINPDFALMPLNTTNAESLAFNQSKSSHKFLQYSMLGIPVIAQDISTYTGNNYEGPAIDNETCLLAKTTQDWLTQIDKFVNDKQLAKKLAQNATQLTENEYTYNDVNIEKTKRVFN